MGIFFSRNERNQLVLDWIHSHIFFSFSNTVYEDQKQCRLDSFVVVTLLEQLKPYLFSVAMKPNFYFICVFAYVRDARDKNYKCCLFDNGVRYLRIWFWVVKKVFSFTRQKIPFFFFTFGCSKWFEIIEASAFWGTFCFISFNFLCSHRRKNV